MAANARPETRTIDWNGEAVEVVADSWVVRATAPSADMLGLAPSWRAVPLGQGFYSVKAPGATPGQVTAWAGTTPGVAYVEPDFVVQRTSTPSDPAFSRLWGLSNTGQDGGVAGIDVHAPAAWDVTTGSRGVVVAVIDTGVDATHLDLSANMWRNPGETPGDGVDNDRNGFVDDVFGWNFIDNNANPTDDNGHGSHVAGTIGAVGNDGNGVVGMNWQVSIMSLRFLDAFGSGSTSAAVAAVNYVTMMRRDHGINVVATNNSWGGGGYSQSLLDAIDAGGRAGILFVAAAGNDSRNTDITRFYPAGYPSDSIISVAATDRVGKLAAFSNYGAASVDVAAPGVSIYSTTRRNAYATMSGTSMATPHVTGAIALLAAANRQASAAQMRQAVLATATPLPGLGGKTSTGGLLNAAAAIQAIGGVAPPTPPPPAPTPPPVSPYPLEPNDTMATATPVVVSDGTAAATAVIGDGARAVKDVDLYSIRLERGQGLTVAIEARSLPTPSPLDSVVRLFDAAGRQLAVNDDVNGSYDSRLTFMPTSSGTYYVGVSSYGNTSYSPSKAGSGANNRTTGPYHVNFAVAPAIVEAGDTLLTATTLALSQGAARLGGIIGDGPDGGRDVDFYRVVLAARQRILIDIDARSLAGSSTLDSHIRLFDNAGRQRATNNDAGGSRDSRLSFTAPAAGTYFIGVSGFANTAYAATRPGSGKAASVGRYEIAVTSGAAVSAMTVHSPMPRGRSLPERLMELVFAGEAGRRFGAQTKGGQEMPRGKKFTVEQIVVKLRP